MSLLPFLQAGLLIQQLWAIKLMDINCLEYTEVRDLKNHCTSVSYYYYYYLTILEETINDYRYIILFIKI